MYTAQYSDVVPIFHFENMILNPFHGPTTVSNWLPVYCGVDVSIKKLDPVCSQDVFTLANHAKTCVFVWLVLAGLLFHPGQIAIYTAKRICSLWTD